MKTYRVEFSGWLSGAVPVEASNADEAAKKFREYDIGEIIQAAGIDKTGEDFEIGEVAKWD